MWTPIFKQNKVQVIERRVYFKSYPV
jgi:hypothetical protein